MKSGSSWLVRGLWSAAVAVSLAGPAWGDAQATYDKEWAGRERAASSGKARRELADALTRSAQGTALSHVAESDRGRTLWDVPYAKRAKAYTELSAEQRQTALLLCEKAVEIGSKQAEGYPAAAEALGMIQEISPDRRLECLLKLEKMYDACYRVNPLQNVGMARGLANVRLQIGQERWNLLRQRQIDRKLTMEEMATGLQQISEIYRNAHGLVDGTIRTLRPYLKQKPEYGEFIARAEEIRKEIEQAQEDLVAPLQVAADFMRVMRLRTEMQDRLKKNPKDTMAADRLVRLNLNEFNDPAAAEAAVPSASESTRQAWALARRPLENLSAAESLQLARWYEKLDDNIKSCNRVALLVRQRLYFDSYLLKDEKAEERRSVELALKRIATDLARHQVNDQQATELATALAKKLKPSETPPDTVAVVTPKTVEGVKPAEPIKASDLIKPPEPGKSGEEPVKPADPSGAPAAKPAETVVVDVPLLPPPPRKTEAQTDKRSSIFDFGREGL